MQYYVCGTDTDAGKTIASAILCKALNASYWKPIQSGPETDSNTLKLLCPEAKQHPEAYKLSLPLSPHIAAEKDSITISNDLIRIPEKGKLIVEAAGGMLVPLSKQQLQIDLVKELQLPIILVSRHRVGSINHTLLSIEAIEARKLKLTGILYSGTDPADNEEIIHHYKPYPNLGCVKESDTIDSDFIKSEAERLKPQLLKQLLNARS